MWPGWLRQQPSAADGHAPPSRAIMAIGCGQPLTQPAGFAGTCVCPGQSAGCLDNAFRMVPNRTSGNTNEPTTPIGTLVSIYANGLNARYSTPPRITAPIARVTPTVNFTLMPLSALGARWRSAATCVPKTAPTTNESSGAPTPRALMMAKVKTPPARNAAIAMISMFGCIAGMMNAACVSPAQLQAGRQKRAAGLQFRVMQDGEYLKLPRRTNYSCCNNRRTLSNTSAAVAPSRRRSATGGLVPHCSNAIIMCSLPIYKCPIACEECRTSAIILSVDEQKTMSSTRGGPASVPIPPSLPLFHDGNPSSSKAARPTPRSVAINPQIRSSSSMQWRPDLNALSIASRINHWQRNVCLDHGTFEQECVCSIPLSFHVTSHLRTSQQDLAA